MLKSIMTFLNFYMYRYLLYPPKGILRSLPDVLDMVSVNSDDFLDVIRVCFAPVALAIDALHASTNRRFNTLL